MIASVQAAGDSESMMISIFLTAILALSVGLVTFGVLRKNFLKFFQFSKTDHVPDGTIYQRGAKGVPQKQ